MPWASEHRWNWKTVLAEASPQPATADHSEQFWKLEPQAFKDAMPGLIFTTVMGSIMSRRHGVDAMNSASGYMEGFQKGDKERMDLMQTNWKNAVDATINPTAIHVPCGDSTPGRSFVFMP